MLAMLKVVPARATELARSLSQPIDKVSYHLTVLENTGYAVPVEGDADVPDPRYESSRI